MRRSAVVNCTNAPTTPARAITCALGLFGGTPSPGICERCKLRVPRDATKGPVRWYVAITLKGKPLYDGSHEWAALYTLAKRYVGSVQSVLDHLAALRLRLPLFGCGCQSHFDDFVKINPPDTTDAASLFAWVAKLHNAVNKRKGVPEWTLEAAKQRWGDTIRPCDWCGKDANVSKGEHCHFEEQFVCGQPICDACHDRFAYCKRHIKYVTGPVV